MNTFWKFLRRTYAPLFRLGPPESSLPAREQIARTAKLLGLLVAITALSIFLMTCLVYPSLLAYAIILIAYLDKKYREEPLVRFEWTGSQSVEFEGKPAELWSLAVDIRFDFCDRCGMYMMPGKMKEHTETACNLRIVEDVQTP